MTAYVVFDVEIRDAQRYQEFMQQVKPALEAAGGRYLARGGPLKVWEGDWSPRRLVIVEFPRSPPGRISTTDRSIRVSRRSATNAARPGW